MGYYNREESILHLEVIFGQEEGLCPVIVGCTYGNKRNRRAAERNREREVNREPLFLSIVP